MSQALGQRETIATTDLADTRWRLPVWALAALLAVVTIAVYGSAIRNGFVDFDDGVYVTHNEHVQAGLSWQNIGWAFRSIEAANWHPLTWISHMTDCQVFGLNPAGHHAVNVMLHAINTVLLFLLLHKATGLPWRSFCVAALFALHPLNVETVAWVSERKSLLSMLFSLLAVTCYGWYARTPEAAYAEKWRRYVTVIFFSALALLAKPMAVTLPLVLLIVDYWPLERMPVPFSIGDAQVWKRAGKLLAEKIPLLAMTIASSWITVVAQHRGEAMTSTKALAMQQRIGNAIVSYAKYIGKMFWPSGLSYYYPHPGNRLATWEILAAAVLLIAITALLWRYRERRYLIFGWTLFVVTPLPVIGIVQVGLQAMADRYAYIPLIGLFVMMVWELSEAAERWHVPVTAQASVAAIVAFALGSVTLINIGYWHDSVTLFSHARRVIPFANTRIETNLGAALVESGRSAEGIEHFKIAESLAPNLFVAHFNIGYALAQAGENSRALPELQEALRTATTSEEKSRALNNLAAAYLDLGKNEQAEQAFSELLELQPNSLAGHAGRGQALFNMGRYEEAGADFVAATELRPAPQLFLMAGKSLEAAGKAVEAEAQYRKALEGNAGLTEARERLNVLERRSAATGIRKN
jgi:tetratricopeptide (TPR) repeat protein